MAAWERSGAEGCGSGNGSREWKSELGDLCDGSAEFARTTCPRADPLAFWAGEAVLQLHLHLTKMTRADPMRQVAQARAAFPRLAPGADQDAKREHRLTRCTLGPKVARIVQTVHTSQIMRPMELANQSGISSIPGALLFTKRIPDLELELCVSASICGGIEPLRAQPIS